MIFIYLSSINENCSPVTAYGTLSCCSSDLNSRNFRLPSRGHWVAHYQKIRFIANKFTQLCWAYSCGPPHERLPTASRSIPWGCTFISFIAILTYPFESQTCWTRNNVHIERQLTRYGPRRQDQVERDHYFFSYIFKPIIIILLQTIFLYTFFHSGARIRPLFYYYRTFVFALFWAVIMINKQGVRNSNMSFALSSCRSH